MGWEGGGVGNRNSGATRKNNELAPLYTVVVVVLVGGCSVVI